MGFFSDVLGLGDAATGGLIGGGLSLLGGIMSNDSNANQSAAANQFSAEQYAKRYQTTVKDMQAAGLSPMLAYSQGAGSAPSGAVGLPQQNVMSSAVDAYHKGAERQAIAADIALKAETAKNQSAQANEAKSRTWNNQLDYMLKEKQLQQSTAQSEFFSSNADIGNLKNKREVQLLTEQIDKVVQEIATGKTTAAQNAAMVDQIKANTQSIKLDQAEKDALNKMWSHVGEGGAIAKEMLPWLQFLKSILKPSGGIVINKN